MDFGFSGTGSLAEAGVPFFTNFISGDLSVVYDTRIFEVRVMKAVGFHAGTLDYNGGLVARIDPGHTVAWAGSPDLGSRPAPWQVVGTGDFNGDGTSDILWRNSVTGQFDQWRMAAGQWAGSIDLGSRSPIGRSPASATSTRTPRATCCGAIPSPVSSTNG